MAHLSFSTWAAKARLGLLLFAAAGFMQAGTITYQVASLGTHNGSPAYRYTYTLSGFDFFANEELDIRFSASLYGELFDGKAGSDFDLLLFDPNSPPGADGDYSALALVNHASLNGNFYVDFTWLGQGLPGSQPYFLFDDSGSSSVQVGSGQTVAAPVTSPVPEPSGAIPLTLSAAAAAALSYRRRARLRS